VDACLELVGPLSVAEETRASLLEYVAKQGDVDLAGRAAGDEAERRVGHLLSLIAATREYQLA
jgi:hypothetical protein